MVSRIRSQYLNPTKYLKLFFEKGQSVENITKDPLNTNIRTHKTPICRIYRKYDDAWMVFITSVLVVLFGRTGVPFNVCAIYSPKKILETSYFLETLHFNAHTFISVGNFTSSLVCLIISSDISDTIFGTVFVQSSNFAAAFAHVAPPE